MVGSSTDPASRPLTTRTNAITTASNRFVPLLAFMTMRVAYLNIVLDALATLSDDAFAPASTTTTVIFIPLWPSPQ
jgi:hypothetical protein